MPTPIKRCCAFLVNMSFDLIRAFANNFMSEVISPYFICHPLYDHRRCCGGGAWGDVLGYENSVIYMACVMLHVYVFISCGDISNRFLASVATYGRLTCKSDE